MITSSYKLTFFLPGEKVSRCKSNPKLLEKCNLCYIFTNQYVCIENISVLKISIYPSFDGVLSINGVPLPVVYSVELFQISDQMLLQKRCLSELCQPVADTGSSIDSVHNLN